MAREPEFRLTAFAPSALTWHYPAEAIRKLDAMAQVAGIGPGDRPRRLPARDIPAALPPLLDALFPDGTTAALPETASALDPTARALLASLLRAARADLARIQARTPASRLGFPPDTRGMWANLLGRSWIPWRQGWMGVERR